ncbi:ATP-binding protein [Leptospira bandrabouensis]|uniref:ATP-binding protein n=1 Tax=Leptospira bandrabouensis TaxID=2484903 RepID=UPI00223DBD0B|nr:ATP-binding protein [Leptospira bandrabouensis]MCW7460189.1 ATP-binding protein [Leptospira bandrabouensis]MCW7479349.1 ATP-binding protein [Leptospira bandrabouensis]MCW7487031.1 ATP-binding protein [Leptospira bandrabouensis]
MLIKLPSRVYDNLGDFLGKMKTPMDGEVVFDFGNVIRFSPVAMVTLICKVKSYLLDGISVYFINHDRFEAGRYFQRMNFFSICNVSMEENFIRHDSIGDFQEIQEIAYNKGSVTAISEGIARCCIPEEEKWKIDDPDENSEIYDLLVYALSELINNVLQHSEGRGFISAQFYKTTELVRIGIADYGIGVLNSFKNNESPHYRENWTDSDAVQKALEPKVSSKNHIKSAYVTPVNAGVGLSILKKLSEKLSGQFCLVSGNAIIENAQLKVIPADCYFKGVAINITFKKTGLSDFQEALMETKEELGLINRTRRFRGVIDNDD